MRKLLKSGNARFYLYLCVLAVMAGLWRTGEAINAQLGTLPVKEAPKAGGNAAALDQKSFYPVWVKQKQATAGMPVAGEEQLDALFRREEELPKMPQVKPLEPDYVQMFRQAVRVDGAADDGLFLNGRFYGVGASMEAFAMTTPEGQRLVPNLESLKNGRAVFRVGAKKVALLLKGAYQ